MGARSVEDVLRELPVRAAARAFALGLKGEPRPGVADVGVGTPEPAAFEPLRSEAADIVLGPMGTMRFCKFELEFDIGGGGRGISSGSGVSSAAGTGRPRAAAIS